MTAASTPGAPPRVLHVVHGWAPLVAGGTEKYAYDLAVTQARQRPIALHARISSPARPLGEAREERHGELLARLVVNDFTARNPWVRNAFDIPIVRRDLAGFLDRLRPDLVHVHHLAGHGISILAAIARRRLPLVYQVQDWWALCARANLCDVDRRRCPGPTAARCARCLPLTRLAPAGFWNRCLHLARRRLLRRALRIPDALVMGSHAIERDHRAAGLLGVGQPVHVLPYGIERRAPRSPPRPRGAGAPLRFGCVATALPHKGLHVLIAAFRGLPTEAVQLDVWGHLETDPAYTAELRRAAAGAGVELRGNFRDGELPALLGGLDVLVVPSIGRESFSLVAHEALAAGVPVLASADGVFGDLFAEGRGGELVAPDDPEALRDAIHRLIAEPERLERLRVTLPAVKSAADHHAEIEAVYRDVLGRRARAL